MNVVDLPGVGVDHGLEAERALIGCLLLAPEHLPDVAAVVDPADCYSTAHTVIYRWLIQEVADGNRPDIVALAQWMQCGGDDRTRQCGGLSYATGLPEQVPSTLNVLTYARIVREAGERRRLVLGLQQALAMAHQGGDTSDVVSTARGVVDGYDSEQRAAAHHRSIGEAMDEWYEDALRRRDAWERGIDLSLSWGFADLDERALIERQNLVILAARPGMGKTSLAMEVVMRRARWLRQHRRPGGIYVCSMEMGRTQLARRCIGAVAGLSTDILMRPHRWTPEQAERVNVAIDEMHALPIYIEDRPALQVEDIERGAQAVSKEAGGLDMVMVDYLQLARAPGHETRTREVGSITAGLLAMSKRMDCLVMALSQLNRACEARADKRPLASDLRDSGEIEQNAQVIAFIYRDEYYNPETPVPGTAEIIFRKVREGKAGTAVLDFREGRFSEQERAYYRTDEDTGF